ncbi:peptide/nickel transport system permease protein/oligopeptide transport system permease protein [Rhizobiales bacterium GAS191]|jgi:ABC-type dipeptide/oligopeptide/nickel transport system permease component|nr:peptide/nickel transport system permease protein/oligopeptide transport system permease protein [Rhizobiales bacterium GAS113]SEC38534.1 peptide/nickel transport system permease protein/oligopeptide transport system permease protein [Rhizobiales bacterium GAS188]SEC88915.1 peptide/nickel transport system permease protein/oligopeptide transport system permease protein [Rhizobiales bacterium GAS191]
MAAYIVKRLLLTIPVVIGILLVTFATKALIPTDAVSAMYQGQLSEQEAAVAMATMRARYHLDRPWYEQFALYAEGIAHGDLGESIRTRNPVIDEIGYRYLNTLKLTFAALLVGVAVGVTSGIVAAYKKDSWLDVTAMTISLFGISMPAFFSGLVVILVFAVWLRWVPVIPSGWTALMLPAFTLGLIEAAPLARITRSSMLDILSRDYIRAARAKGLSEIAVLLRHALPNALLAVATIIGLQIGSLLGGAFIIEVIFGWRGIGELAVKAIQWRDFALTQGIILIGAGSYVLINLAIDLIYTWIDPRIDYGTGS